MKTLELPEPARRLWLETRDALSALDPPARRRPYTPWLGGGTVLAARWKHRLSTDIDVVIRDTTNLGWLQRDDDRNIARRLAARVEAAGSGRIRLRRGAGLIDLNTAPVSPRGGSRNGVEEMLNSHGCNVRRLMRHVEACGLDRRNGVVFDSADTPPRRHQPLDEAQRRAAHRHGEPRRPRPPRTGRERTTRRVTS